MTTHFEAWIYSYYNQGHFLKTIQNILQIPFWQGHTEALLNFPALFSYWSMKWWVHFIDQSEKSEIIRVCFGDVLSPKKTLPCSVQKRRAAKFKKASMSTNLLTFVLISFRNSYYNLFLIWLLHIVEVVGYTLQE